MVDKVCFEGPPFHIGLVQKASATPNPGNGVDLRLHISLPRRDGKPELVIAQMPKEIARDLGTALADAAIKAKA